MPINWNKPIEVRDSRNGDWFWVERYVWRDERLTSSDKVVYGTLAYFSNGKDQESFPSLLTIADEGKLSRAQVALSVKKLRELGYIKVTYSVGKVNRYSLLKNKPVQNLDQSKIEHGVVQPLDGGSLKYGHDQELINKNNILDTKDREYKSKCPLKEKGEHQEVCIKTIEGIVTLKGIKSFPNFPKQIGGIHSCFRGGYTVEEVMMVARELRQDMWWENNGWDLVTISSQLGKRSPQQAKLQPGDDILPDGTIVSIKPW